MWRQTGLVASFGRHLFMVVKLWPMTLIWPTKPSILNLCKAPKPIVDNNAPELAQLHTDNIQKTENVQNNFYYKAVSTWSGSPSPGPWMPGWEVEMGTPYQALSLVNLIYFKHDLTIFLQSVWKWNCALTFIEKGPYLSSVATKKVSCNKCFFGEKTNLVLQMKS